MCFSSSKGPLIWYTELLKNDEKSCILNLKKFVKFDKTKKKLMLKSFHACNMYIDITGKRKSFFFFLSPSKVSMVLVMVTAEVEIVTRTIRKQYNHIVGPAFFARSCI